MGRQQAAPQEPPRHRLFRFNLDTPENIEAAIGWLETIHGLLDEMRETIIGLASPEEPPAAKPPEPAHLRVVALDD
jgi:hypothetical protein